MMDVRYGAGRTEFGPGVSITLTGNEVAMAIAAYLVSHGVHVGGARTITVNGDLCAIGHVYVDPSGFVVANGERLSGRGPANEPRGRQMLRRAPKQKLATVRVQETSDGLIIHPDDARKYGLNWDQPYNSTLTGDGFFRISLPQDARKPNGGDHE